MVVVCAVLGFQQVALKSGSSDMAPILQLAIRSGIAAVLVALLMKFRRDSFSTSDGTLLPGIGLGVIFTFEYVCLGEGLRFTSASRMVVF
ncbi:MAG: drug/metabolite transporter (DMT)-like permease [Granulosicoccus sp.]|jgi:drug/metabolite transporter (DMT)-like permease